MKNSRRDLTPKYVLGMSIFLYLLAAGLGGAVGVAIAIHTGGGNGIYVGVMVCNVLLLPVLISLWIRGGLDKFSISLRSFECKQIGLGIVTILLLNVILSITIHVLSLESSELDFWNEIDKDANIILSIATAVIVGPILEEVFFRGIVFGAIRCYKGFLFASVISSLLFAIGHGLGLYTAISFTTGIVLSAVYEACRNLCVPIAIHMANNLLATCDFASADNILTKINPSDTLLIIITIIMVGVVGMLTAYEIRTIRNKTQLPWNESDA